MDAEFDCVELEKGKISRGFEECGERSCEDVERTTAPMMKTMTAMPSIAAMTMPWSL